MPSHQKDRIAEVEGIVEVVVVDDDRGAETDPHGDDRCCGELGFAGGRGAREGRGDGRGEFVGSV